MTDERALKRSIRRRMQLTGEKYTEARRALVGGTGDQQRYPWSYAVYWEELANRYDGMRDESGGAAARAMVYSTLHSLQLTFTLSPFRQIAWGRAPDSPDGWLRERPQVEYNAATIDAAAPLADVGFESQLARNRKIATRTLALIDMWSAGASAEGCAAVEAERNRLGVRRQAGEPVRNAEPEWWGERSKDVCREGGRNEHHFYLLRPRVEAIRRPLRGVEDPVLLGLLGDWIEDLERNYGELVETMPAAWREHGELDFEASAVDAEAMDPVGLGFRSPARFRVERTDRGELGEEEAVATPIVVTGDHLSPQPDGIDVAVPGERWRVRGHRLPDGTIMPCMGTYRISRPTG